MASSLRSFLREKMNLMVICMFMANLLLVAHVKSSDNRSLILGSDKLTQTDLNLMIQGALLCGSEQADNFEFLVEAIKRAKTLRLDVRHAILIILNHFLLIGDSNKYKILIRLLRDSGIRFQGAMRESLVSYSEYMVNVKLVEDFLDNDFVKNFDSIKYLSLLYSLFSGQIEQGRSVKNIHVIYGVWSFENLLYKSSTILDELVKQCKVRELGKFLETFESNPEILLPSINQIDFDSFINDDNEDAFNAVFDFMLRFNLICPRLFVALENFALMQPDNRNKINQLRKKVNSFKFRGKLETFYANLDASNNPLEFFLNFFKMQSSVMYDSQERLVLLFCGADSIDNCIDYNNGNKNKFRFEDAERNQLCEILEYMNGVNTKLTFLVLSRILNDSIRRHPSQISLAIALFMMNKSVYLNSLADLCFFAPRFNCLPTRTIKSMFFNWDLNRTKIRSIMRSIPGYVSWAFHLQKILWDLVQEGDSQYFIRVQWSTILPKLWGKDINLSSKSTEESEKFKKGYFLNNLTEPGAVLMHKYVKTEMKMSQIESAERQRYILKIYQVVDLLTTYDDENLKSISYEQAKKILNRMLRILKLIDSKKILECMYGLAFRLAILGANDCLQALFRKFGSRKKAKFAKNEDSYEMTRIIIERALEGAVQRDNCADTIEIILRKINELDMGSKVFSDLIIDFSHKNPRIASNLGLLCRQNGIMINDRAWNLLVSCCSNVLSIDQIIDLKPSNLRIGSPITLELILKSIND